MVLMVYQKIIKLFYNNMKLLFLIFIFNFQSNYDISPKDLNQIFNQQLSENIILDVRTKEECSESKIPGSLNIDYYSENFKDNLDKLNKNLNYYIYCRSGNRSGKTVMILREKGFNNVFNLEGGILAWKKENYITN
tara:strand:- start:81 stop:488 length:408 start_codon:yes stop_codon:yes gene_type:complete